MTTSPSEGVKEGVPLLSYGEMRMNIVVFFFFFFNRLDLNLSSDSNVW
jgi:hypothetical protein